MAKATHHLLRFTCISSSDGEVRIWFKIVKQTVIGELEINILNSSANTVRGLIYTSFETVRKSKNVSAYNFMEKSIQITPLMLTKKLELDAKKVHFFYLAFGHFYSDLIRKSLPIYSNVMKCDEVKESDPKRNYHRFFHAS